eukprot:gene679-biopygen7198
MGLLTVNYANIINANVDNVRSNSIASNSTHQQAQPTVLSTTTEALLSIADIENRFGDVFEGLGHMPGKLHLDVDESQIPVAMPPCRVPIALKAKLKAELERLENLHVIQKVTSPTDWVSNLVIAEKPLGNLGLSEVCEPLRTLTHKDAPWVWGEDHDKSFADIQKAICEAPVLKYFDQKAATEGQADASSKGLGFVLMQEGRPVSSTSRAITLAEQNYSQIEKELLAQGQRAVVPVTLRKKIRDKLHVTHRGIQSCLRRAREAVYWPGINKDLIDFISKCEICNTFQNNQAREPHFPREIPSCPCQIIATDIFTVNNKDFICTVDCYSNYFEIDRLFYKTAGEIKKKLKGHFSTHGIPDKLTSDNVPFSSKEFLDFTKEYEFTTELSSPEYAQSNGKAENAVKTAKMLMKKATESGNDFYLVLLEWRNMPSEGMESSPSWRIFSRRAKTLLPMSKKLLKPKVVTGVQEQLRKRKEIQSKYYKEG